MLDFFLLLGTLAVIGTGFFLWKLARQRSGDIAVTPVRRREDARDWQQRFAADSWLANNFLQPTQNEVLETLSVLDYLTPGWEAGEPRRVESRFLGELAVCFPSLRRSNCEFPPPFAATPAAVQPSDSTLHKRPVTENEIAASREAFRRGRVQANALEQMVGRSVVGPAVVTPGSLPFRVAAGTSVGGARSVWLATSAIGATCLVAALGLSYFHPRVPAVKNQPAPSAEPTLALATVVPTGPAEAMPELPVEAEAIADVQAAPDIPIGTEAARDAVPAAPTAALEATLPPATVSTPPPTLAVAPEKVMPGVQIADSQQRAIDKYPALAIEGSEINLRFVFRYKNLLRENSPRLRDPQWPEQLAEECAVAAAASSKRNALTQVNGARR